jgi:hypothetical protein
MKKLVFIILLVLSASALASYTYTIADGMNFGDLILNDTQSILLTGGWGHYLDLNDFSSATINNTKSLISEGNGGIWRIYQNGYSHLEMSGGEIHQLLPGTYSRSLLSGGRIDQIWSYYGVPDPSRITLVCNPGYQITYTGSFVTAISGTWRDGSAFNIQLVNPSGSSSVYSNMTIIPEPATMLLLAVGGMLLRRK